MDKDNVNRTVICDECEGDIFRIELLSGDFDIVCAQCGYTWFGGLNSCLKESSQFGIEDVKVVE